MAPIDLHVLLLVVTIGNSQAEGQSRKMAVEFPTVGLWRNFLEAAVFRSLDSSHTPGTVRTISNSLEGLAASLSPTLLCSHIHHNSINDPGLGSIKSLCGRLTLVINPIRNSDKLLPVYTISVPLLFYLNVSLLGFNMGPEEVEYPVCDWNDIVFIGPDGIETTLCGKPHRQSTFTEGSTVEIMTYHNYSAESKPSSLNVSVEYQISVRYPYDEGRSLHILLHSAVLNHRFDQQQTFFINECIHPNKSKDYQSLHTNRKEASVLPFIDFDILQTTLDDILSLHQLQGINNSICTDKLLYIQGSLVQTSCHNLQHNESNLFQTSRRGFIGQYVSLDSATLRNLPVSRGQFLYKKFTVAHVSLPDYQTGTVYVWSFSIFPFWPLTH